MSKEGIKVLQDPLGVKYNGVNLKASIPEVGVRLQIWMIRTTKISSGDAGSYQQSVSFARLGY